MFCHLICLSFYYFFAKIRLCLVLLDINCFFCFFILSFHFEYLICLNDSHALNCHKIFRAEKGKTVDICWTLRFRKGKCINPLCFSSSLFYQKTNAFAVCSKKGKTERNHKCKRYEKLSHRKRVLSWVDWVEKLSNVNMKYWKMKNCYGNQINSKNKSIIRSDPFMSLHKTYGIASHFIVLRIRHANTFQLLYCPLLFSFIYVACLYRWLR